MRVIACSPSRKGPLSFLGEEPPLQSTMGAIKSFMPKGFPSTRLGCMNYAARRHHHSVRRHRLHRGSQHKPGSTLPRPPGRPPHTQSHHRRGWGMNHHLKCLRSTKCRARHNGYQSSHHHSASVALSTSSENRRRRHIRNYGSPRKGTYSMPGKKPAFIYLRQFNAQGLSAKKGGS